MKELDINSELDVLDLGKVYGLPGALGRRGMVLL